VKKRKGRKKGGASKRLLTEKKKRNGQRSDKMNSTGAQSGHRWEERRKKRTESPKLMGKEESALEVVNLTVRAKGERKKKKRGNGVAQKGGEKKKARPNWKATIPCRVQTAPIGEREKKGRGRGRTRQESERGGKEGKANTWVPEPLSFP